MGLLALLCMAVPQEVLGTPSQPLGENLGWHLEPAGLAQRSLHLP